MHVEQDAHGHLSLDQELIDASSAYCEAGELRTPTVDQIAEHYRSRNMAAVVFTGERPGRHRPPSAVE